MIARVFDKKFHFFSPVQTRSCLVDIKVGFLRMLILPPADVLLYTPLLWYGFGIMRFHNEDQVKHVPRMRVRAYVCVCVYELFVHKTSVGPVDERYCDPDR